MQDKITDDAKLPLMTTEIVSAYLENNKIPFEDVPRLIESVYSALSRVATPPEHASGEALLPAVPVDRSIYDDYLVCLEDGKHFKSLKRHLMTHYQLTADAYRKKWNLPRDYPMVAPNYAKKRSDLARKMGLGRRQKGKRLLESVRKAS